MRGKKRISLGVKSMKKVFVKLICLLIPVKKWRHFIRFSVIHGGISSLRPGKKIRLFYATDGHNFGDILNRNLMDYFGFRYVPTSPLYANVTCIGSTLEFFLQEKGREQGAGAMHVFGSGFIVEPSDGNERFARPVSIHALRGKISKERCEKILGKELPHIALGDPGLLIKRMFPQATKTRRYDVGIICHYIEQDSDLVKNIQLTRHTHIMLDITKNPEDFVKDVAECGFILSSAMHGLICADSLGIPNKHMILGDKVVGGDYKFRDYYSVFRNVEYRPVNLSNSIIVDRDIERYKSEYAIAGEEVDEICDRLSDVFSSEMPRLLE